uniref:DNA repair protein complementing XP-A cells (inferred by orthology to a human protein) n=1 Tax=Strongyloides venezuelensis TaxID=75913 RepID=A0A0K0FNW1_STRVS
MGKNKGLTDVEKFYLKRQRNWDDAGGFDVSENNEMESREQSRRLKRKRNVEENEIINSKNPPPEHCNRCKKDLILSYLWTSYGVAICDDCKVEHEGDYKCITKTDAKQIYLLKDVDLELRKPPLRFVLKKNPRNPKYGDMALFLECQVEERAYEVHGGFEGLEEARRLAAEKSNKRMLNKVKKEMNKIKKDLKDKEIFNTNYMKLQHQCIYGEESKISEDEYKQSCIQCGHVKKYSKF